LNWDKNGVEAWLHELPVICADVRPMSDYITHEERGLLFKPDDVDDLAYWMSYLIQNRKKAGILGQRGHRIARNKFDYEKQLEKLYGILQKRGK